MLMQLKNHQIMDLADMYKKFETMKFKSNKRFSYASVLNVEAISSEVKAIVSIAAPGEEYLEYETKRDVVVAKYAKRDSNGDMVTRDNRWVVFEDEDAEVSAKAEIDALDEEYNEVLAERDNDINEYNSILSEEVEVNMTLVDIDTIPDELAEDFNIMKTLKLMIDE